MHKIDNAASWRSKTLLSNFHTERFVRGKTWPAVEVYIRPETFRCSSSSMSFSACNLSIGLKPLLSIIFAASFSIPPSLLSLRLSSVIESLRCSFPSYQDASFLQAKEIVEIGLVRKLFGTNLLGERRNRISLVNLST